VKFVKTVKCKLQVSHEEAVVLLETLQRFAHACNDILKVSQENLLDEACHVLDEAILASGSDEDQEAK